MLGSGLEFICTSLIGKESIKSWADGPQQMVCIRVSICLGGKRCHLVPGLWLFATRIWAVDVGVVGGYRAWLGFEGDGVLDCGGGRCWQPEALHGR